MAGTTSARTTSTPANKTAAAAKKAATVKKTQPGRTPRKATTAKRAAAKKATTPRLSLVKPPTDTQLPTRRPDFISDAQIYATHAAKQAGIPIHQIRDWRDHRNQTATRPLRDGSLLHYDHTTRTLTWQALCPMGATHTYILDRPSTAAAARVHNATCTQPHDDLAEAGKPLTTDEREALGFLQTPTWATKHAIGEDTNSITVPIPEIKQTHRTLGDQLTKSGKNIADTQPMSLDQIADHIAETAKEHPEP